MTFGEFVRENIGQEYLDLIWSDKNELSPDDYMYHSGKKAWFSCPKKIHEDRLIKIDNHTRRGCHCHECSIIEQHLNQLDDLTGRTFGHWTVVEKDDETSKRIGITYWFCDCDCGTKHKSIPACILKGGKSQSCGCHRLDANTGENNSNWKGGVTSEERKLRNSNKYDKWRKAVFEKDNYTCQACGERGGKLNAHHIKSFADYKDLRLVVDNGITLCEKCHHFKIKGSLHNIYGNKGVTPEMLDEFIYNKKKELGIIKRIKYPA